MTPLQRVFEQKIPELLKKSKSHAPVVIGFAAHGPLERGYWVLSFADQTCRRGTETDKPDVTVEASADVLVLWFSGALNITKALDGGLIEIQGDVSKLQALSTLLGT